MNRWTNTIFIGLLLLSLACVLGYFMMEGFLTQAQQDKLDFLTGDINRRGGNIGQNTETICMAQSNCSSCADDSAHPGAKCGWCTQAQVCIPRSGQYRLIPSWFQNLISSGDKADCAANTASTNQDNFVYSKGYCTDVICSTYTNCRDCAGALACGWSTSKGKCFNKAQEAAKGSNCGSNCGADCGSNCGSNCGSGCGSGLAGTLTTDSSTCPPAKCSEITDCGQCTSTTGCGYCSSNSKCVPVDRNTGSPSGSSTCPQGSMRTQLFQCPCSALTECSDCSQRPGCGYCKTTKKCLTVQGVRERDGDITAPLALSQEDIPKYNNGNTCAYDDIATSRSQCAPQTGLGNVRSESGNYIPSLDELDMTQNNMPLGGNELNVAGSYGGPRGTGSGAVSPPRTSQYISGNGLVRRIGPSSVPYGISRSADLQASPLEDYVKLLVRSELASEGIPMNEPFSDVTSSLKSLFGY